MLFIFIGVSYGLFSKAGKGIRTPEKSLENSYVATTSYPQKPPIGFEPMTCSLQMNGTSAVLKGHIQMKEQNSLESFSRLIPLLAEISKIRKLVSKEIVPIR